ncbi:hypothetical protein DPMN_175872 [Dreissena polymorpha]|uniref:Uncharacterized protein n=1 Tax=Dreissena polymorpha TaxID=45954 RepID=A0A9D4E8K8_DREPO|nr:hypothetical protein DPMN_175872 [Dreissena polymorpha]
MGRCWIRGHLRRQSDYHHLLHNCTGLYLPQHGSSNGAPVGTTPTLTNGGPGSIHGSVHGSHHGSHIGNGHWACPTRCQARGSSTARRPRATTRCTLCTPHPMGPYTPLTLRTQHSQETRGLRPTSSATRAPSYIRSHTPTSSKSGKSHHSNNINQLTIKDRWFNWAWVLVKLGLGVLPMVKPAWVCYLMVKLGLVVKLGLDVSPMVKLGLDVSPMIKPGLAVSPKVKPGQAV